ncbi:hypothetical protein O1W68_12845 [Rhodococcus sp. H36-A4]|uniref:hypothetical protein n=1 Tax=Rhodococcus sp. H36-A4 TaxID=3004353 RepID=UPI0022AFE369|nr:hypothetical protein [Rhodococcus sp. H36-A4]MCZ4078836.1 hypothetical protein [Rhodococcus sp. H36-A4]
MSNALTDHDQSGQTEDSTFFGDILTEANRRWRRMGVRRTDRQEMLTELKDELSAADADG